MVATITREALAVELERGAAITLVEALPEKYYLDRHLPGAVNLPLNRLDDLAPALLPDKTAEIVVYCASGPCKNSGIAAARLTELGYEKVRDYHEGKADWIAAGLPTESGAGRAVA